MIDLNELIHLVQNFTSIKIKINKKKINSTNKIITQLSNLLPEKTGGLFQSVPLVAKLVDEYIYKSGF
ncbi:hypothetical protein BpHYR1_026039 [Brachionus plicatilis]|uniref:Uncharacterized protein n=1 Tax=Brachionus plicatilis TaxID=10195 RepID=A0A3M7T0M2_BRAPC|nr:hypothetical protein BpHYR1_026039 [Brachionus plicatilis]